MKYACLLVVCLLTILFYGCSKDKPQKAKTQTVQASQATKPITHDTPQPISDETQALSEFRSKSLLALKNTTIRFEGNLKNYYISQIANSATLFANNAKFQECRQRLTNALDESQYSSHIIHGDLDTVNLQAPAWLVEVSISEYEIGMIGCLNKKTGSLELLWVVPEA